MVGSAPGCIPDASLWSLFMKVLDAPLQPIEKTGWHCAALLAQIALYEGYEFGTIHRLGDVVVASALETGLHVRLFATSGDQNDWNLPGAGLLTHHFASFESIHAGHHNVHQN